MGTWTHPVTNVTSPVIVPAPEPVAAAPVPVVVQAPAEPIAAAAAAVVVAAAAAPEVSAPMAGEVAAAAADPFLTTTFSAGVLPDTPTPGSVAAAPVAPAQSAEEDAALAQRLQDEENRANSPHAVALTHMAAMGFFDQEKNEALLKKHKGNVQAVVAELIT